MVDIFYHAGKTTTLLSNKNCVFLNWPNLLQCIEASVGAAWQIYKNAESIPSRNVSVVLLLSCNCLAADEIFIYVCYVGALGCWGVPVISFLNISLSVRPRPQFPGRGSGAVHMGEWGA